MHCLDFLGALADSTFCNSTVFGTMVVCVVGMLRIEAVFEQVYTMGSWSWDSDTSSLVNGS